MRHPPINPTLHVIFLTLITLTLGGCSVIKTHYSDTCKSHAYVQNDLGDYITSRFHSNAPVRLAIIPFTAPANIAAYSNDRPGLGNELAWKVHAQILALGEIPIVEVLNRQDWPAKKEEFFTGNFGAIGHAREAGYDFALVGQIEDIKSLDTLTVNTKLIEVESGITVWYGKTIAHTGRKNFENTLATVALTERVPSELYLSSMIDTLVRCLAEDATGYDEERPWWEKFTS